MSVAVGAFAVFAASQIGTPGPANMAVMTAGAAHGFRAVLPFLTGVILGKQLIIWPMGFGLLELARAAPLVFEALKWIAAAYIVWLAWRVANTRLGEAAAGDVPGFASGLIVHPINPKAWAMITAGFTSFTAIGTPAPVATAWIAGVLLTVQLVLQPLWAFGGAAMAARLRGRPAERYLMWTLAALTVLSVLFVLFGGGNA
ncbi:LysE family translocator [Jannaschia sp. LMIT008]|uniref:LysE family translocator n=1 Tax=Jannaschia maritima TaxID=3032585 RepID=UPI00281159EF|nr:LysE family transporter [Jannaschia sp. LMIT008]